MKKFIIANAIGIILMSVFLVGFTASFELPVYADSTTDEWLNVTTNQQLVEAFRYYCKSRDLTIEGSIADGVTTFTTNAFNGICNTLGIDITALQAEIKYRTDSNVGLQYLFTTTGVTLYNRIFSQFLQDNDLSVGDAANEEDNIVYSGSIYTDPVGNSCLVYISNTNITYQSGSSSWQSGLQPSYITAMGTKYIYSGSDLYNLYVNGNRKFSVPAINASYDIFYTKTLNTWDTEYINVFTNNTRTQIFGHDIFNVNTDEITVSDSWDGNLAVIYTNNKYYLGSYCIKSDINENISTVVLAYAEIPQPTTDNCIIYLTTNNTVINNNNYEGDTIINNDGTTGDDDDSNYNPYPGGGGTITPPGNTGGNGSDGTINFPDFNINLPEINWSLGDLSNKFPFSIPFDMIAFLTLLNGEPQAPHITGSIPLSSQITWELDLDFAPFDDFASIMRGLEFVGFMFFLISATINIVRG